MSDWWKELPRFTTLAELNAGEDRCILSGDRAVEAGRAEQPVRLSGPLLVQDGQPWVPADFFTAVMRGLCDSRRG